MSDSDWEYCDKEYQVENFIDIRTKDGKKEIKVKWVGYSESKATWEPLKNFKTEEFLKMIAELKDKQNRAASCFNKAKEDTKSLVSNDSRRNKKRQREPSTEPTKPTRKRVKEDSDFEPTPAKSQPTP